MLSRHRKAALVHFLCAALASLILEESPLSASSEDIRHFFSGSRLGAFLRLQKTHANIREMMMTVRATDKETATRVSRRVVGSILMLVQPVGNVETSKSSGDVVGLLVGIAPSESLWSGLYVSGTGDGR